MTNAEKYKTAKERSDAFNAFCDSYIEDCDKCPLGYVFDDGDCAGRCAFSWLDLEAKDEKPLPCPFCGGECECEDVTAHTPIDNVAYAVYCQRENCMYQGKMYPQYSRAIAAHNRVAKAVNESEESK